MRMIFVGLGVFASLSLAIVGCSAKLTETDGGTSGPTPDDAGTTPIDAAIDTAPPDPTIDAPQITSAGGPVLKTPKIVPIYFKSDAFQPQLQTFLGKLVGSAYWRSFSTEFGVSDLTLIDKPVLAVETPTATVQDHADPTAASAVKSFLQDHLTGAVAGWPAADEDAIYTIFYPASTTVKLDTAQSCQEFGGYHNETTITTSTGGTKKIVYAILPRCSGAAEGLTDLDSLTVAATHELWEAASDPYPFTAPAFNLPDANHVVWQTFPLPELGDMCAQNKGANFKPAEIGFMVQRMWSNTEAKHGHDPCVPLADGETGYFNAIPLFTEKVPFNFSDNNGKVTAMNTAGVSIAVGQSKAVPVKVFADGAVSGQVDLVATDLGPILDPTQNDPELTFAFDKTSASVGETVTLTITRVASAASDTGGSAFVVVAKQGGKTGPATFWTGFAGEP